LVHDAVRPCVSSEELERLLAAVDTTRPDGALLAVPVRDTLKRGGPAGQVECTVPREGLWQALTPQLFPVGALLPALEALPRRGAPVTDEAQAMELAGHAPSLVPGAVTNIKLTHAEDLALITLLLGESQEALP
jgi:2-C-methyl-D-erythritol 4-phosphate cytidylyltransferase